MFTSFDEKVFRQAIKDKDYLCLKVNTVSSMLDDPTFKRGETMEILRILEEQVPEIFEEYVELDYEEHLEREAWDKRYFTKLTYWFQENFAKERVAYIKEVGNVVHRDTAKQYAESNTMKSKLASESSTVKQEQNRYSRKAASNPALKPQEKKKGNFMITGAILAAGALVVAGILLLRFLVK